MSDRRLLRVRVQGEPDVIEAFLAAHPLGCERIERVGGRLAIEVFIHDEALDAWRDKLDVKVVFDAAARMRELIKTVGRGDRFAHGAVPAALGLAGRRVRG